jgi:RND family efflux transporter MFP subunit
MKPQLIIAASLLLAACGAKDEKPAAPPPAAVETAVVEAPRGGGLTASGRLERRREMVLSFRIAGVITDLRVDAGDSVSAGQMLATIDPSAVNARSAQAGAELERVRRDLKRDQQLYDRGYVSQQRIDDRRSAVKAAQAAMDSADFDRRWSRLSSPAGGVVLERLAQRGEVVQPGQAVLKVADLNSPLVLRASLADRDLARIGLGQSVTVRFDALPGQVLTGKVVKLGQAADARTGAVEVEVELASNPALRSGLVGQATFSVSAEAADFVRVPAEAILEANGERAFVLRLNGDKARRVAVGFGGFEGDHALIRGLEPGARVITAGAGFVSDGQTVRVTDAEALARAVR